MKKLLAGFLLLWSAYGQSQALSKYTDYVTAYPSQSKKGQWVQMLMKGVGVPDQYVLEVDPATGQIPVSASVTLPYDTNYGTVGASTLRTAAQIGNATGAAAFNAGTTSAQTLRVVLPTDQTAIPATQSGAWTTGRTWSLLNTTDSVNAVQSGAWTTGRTWTLSNGTDSIAAVQSGTWNINDISGTISLPTGAASSANQGTEITSLANIDANTASIDGKLGTLGQKAMAGSAPVVIASDQSSIPVSATLSSDTNYGTVGAGTLRTAAQIGNATGAAAFNAGTTTAQTLRVVLPTDQTAVPASQSGTWNINNVSGTVSLPTGASTEATLSTLNGKVADDFGASSGAVRTAAQVGNATGAADFNTGAPGAQTLRTVISSRSESVSTPLASQLSNGTSAVDYNSGAAANTTLRTVLATRHESVATPLAAQLSNGSIAVDYNSGSAGAATIRVVPSTRSEAATTPLAVRITDGTVFAPSSTKSVSLKYRNDYSSANVTTAAYVQVTASTSAVINKIWVFDSSGSAIILATGGAGTELDTVYIPPGGFDSPIEVNIPSGTRLSLKALDVNATSGQIIINAVN